MGGLRPSLDARFHRAKRGIPIQGYLFFKQMLLVDLDTVREGEGGEGSNYPVLT